MTDSNGLYYMRARYYLPETLRFINADTLKGTIQNSTTLNYYAYVNGNPVSLIDPMGMSSEPGGKTGDSISFDDLSSKLSLLRDEQLGIVTKLKSLLSSDDSLNAVLRYSSQIHNVANSLSVPVAMIQSILYRELICFGLDDIAADEAVKLYYSTSPHIGKSDSSTGLGQVTAKTAIDASNDILYTAYNRNNDNDVWSMWQRLQDNNTNIYYVGVVLKYEARRIGITLKMASRTETQQVFSRYNGSSLYGAQTILYYDLFKKFASGV